MSQTLKAYGTGIVLLLVWTGGAMTQAPTESDRARKAALQMARGHEIPEATLPCSPEEAKWWEDLRAAGKAVQETRGGTKEKEKFLRLLQQGQENSYQPPIPDSKVIVLSKVPPRYNEEARRRKRSGTVALVVELRPDGFVGEVEIVQGLGSGLDEDAAPDHVSTAREGQEVRVVPHANDYVVQSLLRKRARDFWLLTSPIPTEDCAWRRIPME